MSRSKLSECLNVEDNQVFYCNGCKYRVSSHGRIQYKDTDGEWVLLTNYHTIYTIIADSTDLEKQIIYSDDTIRAAKYDSLRYKYVMRDSIEQTLTFFVNEPPYPTLDRNIHFLNIHEFVLNDNDYPEIEDGKCIALSEITGSTEVIKGDDYDD